MNSLLLTAHDYRTPRKANMHFIADELVEHGAMRFFSLRYSALSKRKGDARTFLDERANRIERVGGVECFLWKALLHPFNTRRAALRSFEDMLFHWARSHVPEVLRRWMREADVIFFESGSAILHIALARQLNPAARKVYIASDDLDVIHVAGFIKDEFGREAATMDALCLPSPLLAAAMPPSSNKYFVPHGLDKTIADRADPNPYERSLNAVSVGSMLFDRTFFDIAAAAFPDIAFHVIGAGRIDGGSFPTNVRVYDEMPHDETLRFIKHAQIGIAPYIAEAIPPYLADTSMKLMQYRFFGVPAVCPGAVVGGAADRFGYQPRSRDSIVDAVTRAMHATPIPGANVLSWRDVTDRLIDSARYPDTRLESVPVRPSFAGEADHPVPSSGEMP